MHGATIKVMSQVFTYDVATLIELIESKPCLWDKTSSCAAFKIKLTTGSGTAGTCEKLHDRSRIRLRQKAGVCASALRKTTATHRNQRDLAPTSHWRDNSKVRKLYGLTSYTWSCSLVLNYCLRFKHALKYEKRSQHIVTFPTCSKVRAYVHLGAASVV
jgi:hypothetical protein